MAYKKKIQVSVIMPYYRKKFFFKRSLNSFISQRYRYKELIIVYDDENKNELNQIKKLIKKYKNIILLINKKNIGAGLSRNKAARIAKGKYIAFLDADDIWKSNKIKIQLDYMRKNNIKISHTSYSIINKDQKIIGYRRAKLKQNYYDLLNSCDIGLSSVILERKLFLKNQFSSNKTKEDYVVWLKISKKLPIYGINKFLLLWRKTENSLSSDTFQKLMDAFNVYYKKEGFNFLYSIYRVGILSMNYFLKRIKQNL